MVRATGDEFDIDWSDGFALERLLVNVLEAFYIRHRGANPHFVTVLTTFRPDDIEAFYLPLANDTRGIGQGHVHPAEVFDTTPDLAVDGLIFMNDMHAWRGGGRDWGRYLFIQELGHRWGAYVHVDAGELRPDILLGRDCAHWSYFVDSDGSALGGNRWRPTDGDGFSAHGAISDVGYSALDRYLMGFAPASAVAPFRVLLSDAAGPCREIDGNSAHTDPHFDDTPVVAEALSIELDARHVITAEGPRTPGAARARRRWSMVFVLLVPADVEIDDATIAAIDELRADWAEFWSRAATDPNQPRVTLETTLSAARAVPFPPGRGLGEPCVEAADCVVEAGCCAEGVCAPDASCQPRDAAAEFDAAEFDADATADPHSAFDAEVAPPTDPTGTEPRFPPRGNGGCRHSPRGGPAALCLTAAAALILRRRPKRRCAPGSVGASRASPRVRSGDRAPCARPRLAHDP